MSQPTPYARAKYETAAAIAVLTFDTTGERVSDLMAKHTSWGLKDMLAGLLDDLDARVSSEGQIEINVWIDGAWLATAMQTELGSSVDARRDGGKQFLFLVNPDA